MWTSDLAVHENIWPEAEKKKKNIDCYVYVWMLWGVSVIVSSMRHLETRILRDPRVTYVNYLRRSIATVTSGSLAFYMWSEVRQLDIYFTDEEGQWCSYASQRLVWLLSLSVSLSFSQLSIQSVFRCVSHQVSKAACHWFIHFVNQLRIHSLV